MKTVSDVVKESIDFQIASSVISTVCFAILGFLCLCTKPLFVVLPLVLIVLSGGQPP